MKNGKIKYFYKFINGYCAGSATTQFCKEEGVSTSGTETGEGWGSTPKKAKQAAKRNMKRKGNCNIEWVYGETFLYDNGKLIQHSY